MMLNSPEKFSKALRDESLRFPAERWKRLWYDMYDLLPDTGREDFNGT